MSARTSWLRLGALLAAGAFAVHQLRYLVAYGDGADHALRESGHGYLSAVGPLIGLSMALLAAQLLLRLVAPSGPSAPATRRGLTVLLTGALIVVFTSQEMLEGLLVAGHDHGLAGVFGGGGWTALPLALLIGMAFARFVRLADAATRADLLPLRLAAPTLPSTPADVVLRPQILGFRNAPLARHLAGRAPPYLVS